MDDKTSQTKESGSQVLRSFPKEKKNTLFVATGAFLVVLLGVGSGWLLSGNKVGTKSSTSPAVAPGAEKSKTEAGVEDTSKYPDQAEGTLVEGGIDGEGTHHLERPGGETQYVYLTSTVIDLQSFVGKKVQVWGETVSGKKAGWLMDVGKLKVTE